MKQRSDFVSLANVRAMHNRRRDDEIINSLKKVLSLFENIVFLLDKNK